MPQTSYWHSLGWRELQLHANEMWHYPIRNTCKDSTVRDFVWVSPELLAMLVDVEILPHVFPDHAVILGRFRGPATVNMMRYWHFPHVIPWDEVDLPSWHSTTEAHKTPFNWGDDLSKSFEKWSDQVESSLHGHVSTDNARLPTGCRGRGRRNQTRWGKIQLPVMKPSRPGEIQVSSTLCAMPVQRWYKQLRRMQSLLHGLRNGALTSGAWSYQALCWKAIKHSSGFHEGFFRWWPNRRIKVQGSPHSLPEGCPSLAQMECIYCDFKMNYRCFEQWNLQKRMKLQQLKREKMGKDLFSQLKPSPPATLEVLTTTCEAQILQVHSSTDKVLLSADLSPSIATTLVDEVAKIVPCDPPVGCSGSTWVHLDCDIIPVPGQKLVQTRTLSTPHDIETELMKLWLPRWQNDAHLDASTWERILAFAHHYLPRNSMAVPTLVPMDFKQSLSGGTSLKTRGPDGWAPADFVAMPDCLLDDLLHLVDKVETGSPWPQQLVQGHVTCLEKRADPKGASDYRPVVLFSLLYRWWGSLRSRKLLADFSAQIDFGAHGFLAGRCCQHITYYLMGAIEHSLKSGEALSGFLTDIEKCFNFLPRKPLLQVAKHLGVPDEVLRGWSSFLQQMTRNFIIHRQVGRDCGSTAGLPEGDSLSCLGMLMANYTFHFYLQHFRPSLSALSFVDNLEVTGRTAVDALAGFITTQVWADMLQLRLDQGKTFFWSTLPHKRRSLKAFGLTVIESGSDLGAAMQYGAKHRNADFTNRIQSVNPYWNRLRNMHVSSWHKQLAIKQALLPRALHNISHVLVGQHWLKKLRTKAMRALRLDRAGANPMIRLSYFCDMEVDPGFYDFWHSVRDFQIFAMTHPQVKQWWRHYRLQDNGTTHGPFGKLLKMLPFFGWHIDADAQLTILGELHIDLTMVDIRTLRFLCEYYWRQHVAHSVVHRKDFSDLDGIDYEASCGSWKPKDLARRELLHCIQDGTFHLATSKAHFDPRISSDCPHCGEQDTLEHRALRCPRYQHIRVHYDECCTTWTQLPVVCTHHGLMPENPWQLPFWKELTALPWQPPTWKVAPRSESIQFLFTDGACRMPSMRPLSLASWAIVNASDGQILGSGILPHILQTIGRAELWAVILAFDWSLKFHTVVWIHSDSAYVVDGCQYLMRHEVVPTKWADQDLWRILLWYLTRVPAGGRILKVRAHQEEFEADDEHQAWCIYWNAIADVNAKTAGKCAGPASLHSIHEALVTSFHRHRDQAVQFQQFLLDMAIYDLEHKTVPALDDENFEPLLLFEYTSNMGGLSESFPASWQQQIRADSRMMTFGADLACNFVQWLLQVESRADFCAVVTLVELLMAFRLETQVFLPILVERNGSSHWQDVRCLRAGELAPRTLASQVRVFRHLLMELDRILGCSWEWGTTTRPESRVMKALESVVFPWPSDLAERTHFELLSLTARRPIQRTADLARPWL